jgi:hypothetical protein
MSRVSGGEFGVRAGRGIVPWKAPRRLRAVHARGTRHRAPAARGPAPVRRVE